MISSSGYLKAASDIILRLMETQEGRQVLEDFIKWRLVDGLVPLLSKSFRQERSDLNNRLSGLKPRPLQKISWKKCIKATEKKFKYALGHIYVKEKELEGKTTEDIEDVLEIISKIQKSLEDRLSNTTWMDADTKGKASAKSKLIRSLVGYPDTVLDQKKLTKLYK